MNSSKSTEPREGPLLPQAAQRTIDARAIFLPGESNWPSAATQGLWNSEIAPVSQILTLACAVTMEGVDRFDVPAALSRPPLAAIHLAESVYGSITHGPMICANRRG
jgi:hypothetical protein